MVKKNIRVKAHRRKLRSGKVINVKSHVRSVKDRKKRGTKRYDVKRLNAPGIEKKKKILAFGLDYDPKKLESGITKYDYSHTLEDGSKLYTFEPKLPFRLFNVLAEEMNYEFSGTVLKKGDIEIGNSDFITKGDPKKTINQLNKIIKKIFKEYEPAKDWKIERTPVKGTMLKKG